MDFLSCFAKLAIAFDTGNLLNEEDVYLNNVYGFLEF